MSPLAPEAPTGPYRGWRRSEKEHKWEPCRDILWKAGRGRGTGGMRGSEVGCLRGTRVGIKTGFVLSSDFEQEAALCLSSLLAAVWVYTSKTEEGRPGYWHTVSSHEDSWTVAYYSCVCADRFVKALCLTLKERPLIEILLLLHNVLELQWFVD